MKLPMIDLNIPANTLIQWQKLLQSLQRVIGYKAILCSVNEHNVYVPCVTSYAENDGMLNTAELDLFCQSVISTESPFSDVSFIPDSSFMTALPVYWQSRACFGTLIILSDDRELEQDHLLVFESTVSHIEKDLTSLYQEEKSSYRLKLESVAGEYQAPDFQQFIDSFQDHLWVKDMNGVYTYCNKSVEAAWLTDLTNVVGHTDQEIFDQEKVDKFSESDRKVIQAGKQLVVEECSDIADPDNKSWLETIKAPIIDDSGNTVGIIGMTRSVANRKVIEDQLMVAGTVFENSVEGVIISDKNGNIAFVNKAFCDITGYSETEAIGRNPRFLKSGRHEDAFYSDMWQSLMESGKWKGEIWNRRKDGGIYPEQSTISVVYDENDEICNFVAVFADISQLKQSEAELTHMAYHDPLTDLPNRLKLSTQIEHEILHVERNLGQFATIFIDIDHFKHINDTYGHLIGDEVLCEIAQRLKQNLRAEDTVARIGGDEFVLLLTGLIDLDSVTSVVSKLMKVFELPVELSNGELLRFTGSMGIAMYPGDGNDSDTLLRNADAAMYRAKHEGRNDYAFYTEALTKESEAHLKLQSAMHEALENDGFQLFYQPQVNMLSGKLIGFESLIRWNHPKLGMISPMEFIPVAEKTGLIHDIGRWVLKTACEQGVKWLEQGYDFGRIAVNIAGPQLQRETFVEQVIQIIQQTGLATKYLDLEITEGFMMHNPENSIKYLDALRRFGIEISMDDFGTGYSSLSYLQRLPLNKIKIDRSFVNNLPYDSNDIAITDAIIALGNALSLKVIAEGVETKEQAEFLRLRGCMQGQGYYFGKPQSPDKLISLLEKTRDRKNSSIFR